MTKPRLHLQPHLGRTKQASSQLTLQTQPQFIQIISPKLPDRRPFILRLFDAKMEPGFVLITKRHLTCDYTAQLCDNASKQQAQRKSMQKCFMHARFWAFAVPLCVCTITDAWFTRWRLILVQQCVILSQCRLFPFNWCWCCVKPGDLRSWGGEPQMLLNPSPQIASCA